MLTNSLTIKGKTRVLLSQCKTTLFELLNIKKRLTLHREWSNISPVKKKIAIIIADGPSLTENIAKQILSQRKSLDVVAMNNYFLNNFSKYLIPDYYLLSDPENFQTNSHLVKKNNNRLKKYVLNPSIKLIVPYGSRSEIYKKPYLQFNDSENLKSNNIDPRYSRGYRSNTGFKAIAFILSLNYSEIFIIGFDYDYPRKIFLNKKNKLYLEEEHSYGSKKIDCHNLFDSVAHAMHWWAQDYWHLKKLASPKIKNVTNNSLIDVFERITFENFSKYIQNISRNVFNKI
jgi:hypothetical protein